MAIISEGINGGFTGKAGSVVGYNRMGKWIIRGLPRAKKKNRRVSAGQQASRSVFTKMQYFLSPIVPFIRVGFNMESRSRQITAHNAAKSYNMLNAFTPEGEIDYSKVLVSFGKLPGALAATLETDDAGLHFSWNDNSKEKDASSDDQVMLLAYNVAKKGTYWMLSGARRKVGKETLKVGKSDKPKVLHTYIAFISDDRQRISMSTYLGEIVY
ncbi:DUF6266 family protein [Pedobacter insulae]|uniref:Uncharacterized protein n=1 Tax=Pedobacter insulae TaxID=414048 RepID=A0A1I3AL35_9SPHI|nr:DUF6266 family protein [Pedobacter insulae]SFH50755.1 hypothetical protein SAMN04489864_11580 [Pedobacter insulae]